MNSSAKPLPPLELPLDDMKRLGYAVIDHLVEYWASLPTLPTTRHASRAALEAVLREPPPRGPSDPDSVFRLAMETVFGNVIDCCHPRNFSWVPSPGNFISVLADALTVGHNVSPGIWLEASGPSQVEVITIDWLRELCGLPDTSGGIFTSGGSMANLTALMAARTDRVGVHSDDAIIYHTNQAHASLTRGYRILGFRADQCRAVETDDEFRMSPSSLRAAIRQDRAEGKQPFCVVASAGTTNTGTVDPLAEIAAVCRDEGLWLHVDGAYGAATILTERGRALLEGLEMADSLSIDPHKWLFQPIEMGCCLVRDARTLVAGFSERPEYLQDAWQNSEVNFLERGPQFTRTSRAMKLWISVKVFGLDAFRDAIDVGLSSAEFAQELLAAHPRFEVVTKAQLGIVTFRYCRSGMTDGESDNMTRRIFDAILGDGHAMLTTTSIRGRQVLRLCTINPRTTRDDLRSTVDMLCRLGDQLSNGS